MGYLYLIKEDTNNGEVYKIGVTSEKDANKRLKKLQTGNPNLLSFLCLYETEYPFKLEKMMHSYFRDKKILNEWYELDYHDIENFLPLCEKNNNIILSLKDNPFF